MGLYKNKTKEPLCKRLTPSHQKVFMILMQEKNKPLLLHTIIIALAQ